MIHPLVAGVVRMNAAIRAKDPALWEQIRHMSASHAWARICETYGFERAEGQSVTGAADMVCSHLGCNHK